MGIIGVCEGELRGVGVMGVFNVTAKGGWSKTEIVSSEPVADQVVASLTSEFCRLQKFQTAKRFAAMGLERRESA